MSKIDVFLYAFRTLVLLACGWFGLSMYRILAETSPALSQAKAFVVIVLPVGLAYIAGWIDGYRHESAH